MERFVAVTETTAGRDKLYRVGQYFARYLGARPALAGVSTAAAARRLEANLAAGRKRAGRPCMHAYWHGYAARVLTRPRAPAGRQSSACSARSTRRSRRGGCVATRFGTLLFAHLLACSLVRDSAHASSQAFARRGDELMRLLNTLVNVNVAGRMLFDNLQWAAKVGLISVNDERITYLMALFWLLGIVTSLVRTLVKVSTGTVLRV
jgi:hypothetical protein